MKGVSIGVENSCPTHNYTRNVEELSVDVISDRSLGTLLGKREMHAYSLDMHKDIHVSANLTFIL